MSFGLVLRNAAGSVVFDSTLAIGGVCLGFYSPTLGQCVFEFVHFVGNTGVVLNANVAVPALLYTVDNTLGHLRFTFDSACIGGTYVLFAV